jgi:hypothetical protein
VQKVNLPVGSILMGATFFNGKVNAIRRFS